MNTNDQPLTDTQRQQVYDVWQALHHAVWDMMPKTDDLPSRELIAILTATGYYEVP